MRLWWLYAEVSALYSSIYLYPGDRKRKKILCERHMHAKVAEAEWTWSLRRKDRPVILFTKMELDPYSPSQNLFYSKEELFCSYEWTAQLGVDGLIIWSSSKQIGERCHSISVYLNNVFGPFVQKLIENTKELRDKNPHYKIPVGDEKVSYNEWRPEWSLNWAARRIYQLESTKDVLERFPGISEKSATEIGRELFNKRARKFTVETIRLGRKLRPKALWGFYDTPLCNYDAGERWPVGCLELFRKHNDKLWWLYAEVSALYSSIYLYPGDRKRKKILCERHMHAKVAEAEWTWSLRRKDRPVILFTKMELDPYSPSQNLFYSKEELFCSYEWTAQLGVDGLIIWSSSKQIGERCHSISVYLNNVFGPFVQKLIENTKELRDKNPHYKIPVGDEKVSYNEVSDAVDLTTRYTQ
uniref:Hyaluronidase n=1 Tax=Meloidogyne incognita TaxID=6306 RepID=A0A914KH90_MELIC